ncbi:MAG: EboA domain-containing protein, partial [Saprospiraceae bacterium]|nr:EboA domain-containing protein [Saprospiraceae bacterium]
ENIDSSRTFFLNFGLIARKIPRIPVSLDPEQLKYFQEKNPGFNPGHWSLDDLCRLSLLLALDTADNKDYISTLLAASDMREQVIIYRSLPYLPNPEEFILLAVDGIRTNMVDVFDSIALDNNFPFRHFSEDAWNQMVLKAIFMERPVYRIYGLDDRRNQTLADILHDFVHERWSAKRPVTPELWRLVRGHIRPEIFEDLKKVTREGNELETQAAIKALQESEYEPASQWLSDNDLPETSLSWEEIGKRTIEGK